MKSTVSNVGQGEYRTKVSGPYFKIDLYNDAGDVVLSQWLEQPPHLETAHRNWIVCHFSRELKEWLQKSTAQL
jgi:hypothetical protein